MFKVAVRKGSEEAEPASLLHRHDESAEPSFVPRLLFPVVLSYLRSSLASPCKKNTPANPSVLYFTLSLLSLCEVPYRMLSGVLCCASRLIIVEYIQQALLHRSQPWLDQL